MAELLATTVSSNPVSKLGEYLFVPIGRQFRYVLCYKSYVQDLENGIDKLESMRIRVRHSVEEAENDGKLIENDIKMWLETVENEAKQARDLLKHCESAKNACFLGWLPNPVVRHPIGRKVKKITQVIQELHVQSTKNIFQKVYYESTPIGIVTTITSTTKSVNKKEDALESRASITKDVMQAIVDDQARVIGVWGASGVGKSKLLEDIEIRVKEEKLFDVVVMANVSRNQDLKEIQGEIAYALGLTLTNDEPTRGRADRLCKRLESDPKKKILIILDNLWKKLELKEVGIPCGDDNKVRGCKLLLTSRHRNVLRNDMVSDQEFRLKELEHGEARKLFERTIGENAKIAAFEPLIDKVVENCGGLPLLIISVAKRLKHGDEVVWRNAMTDRRELGVSSIVEPIFNDLQVERIRSLFFTCALNYGKIPITDFLLYCMGLGLYDEYSKTIESARDKLILDLRSLQDSSLLLDSNGTKRFRMHDIFVDETISIASKERNVLVGKGCGFKEWSNDELRKCTAISFRYVGIDEVPKNLHCPNLRMLLLIEDNPLLKIPESFFKSMKKLRVLRLTGISFTSLPSSIKILEHLKSLFLDFCHLEDVTLVGQLKGLQFLSFYYSTIVRLPKEIGQLTELRFLELRGCTGLKVIEPGVFESLVNLEELRIGDSFDQWEAKDEAPLSNASLTELKNMKKLTTLYIAIPHSVNLPRDLPFGKLNQHKIQIGDVWDWSNEYKESRTLKLKLDSGDLPLEEWVQTCLQRTEDLHLDGFRRGSDSIYDLCNKGFEELKHLRVQNSPLFQYVVHSTKIVQCTVFTRLESLVLENLNNLEKICHGDLAIESFSKLKIVKVDDCGEIRYLFPLSMKRIFLQLEEIEISRCPLMQQIIEEDGGEINNNSELPCHLRRLILQNLPEMMSLWKTVVDSIVFFNWQQVSFPWLESLTLSELPKLKEIWNAQFPSDVSNLKILKVKDCSSLSTIIPSNLLIKLHNLEAITVERCQLIQEVFDLQRLTASGDFEILSQLTELTLSDLPSLGCIWNKYPRGKLCFRNLRALKVQNCENLRFLFSSSMAKALKQIKEIEIVSCELIEEIIDVQEEESEEVAAIDTLEFPSLTSLSLEKLPELKTFSYGKYYIHCPFLTRLTISRCPQMMTFSSFEGRQQSMTIDTGLQEGFGCTNSGLSLRGFFNEKVLFPSLEELKLSSMKQVKRIWHDQLHEQSFWKLASLTVELCENLLYVFPSNSMDRLQSLNNIEVVGCPALEALFESVSLSFEKRQKPLVLSVLKKMKLLNLPRLRDILKSDDKVTLAFPSLMEVNVRRCHGLPYIFSSTTARTLDKLVVLDVSRCNNLWVIIAMEEGKGKIVETFKFFHLSTLKLGDLEKLICFSSESCVDDGLHPLFDEKLAFPMLEELHVKGIQHEELWNNKILVESFCRLKVLKVKRCHNLMNVIPSFMWKRPLHCMESLTIEKCSRLRNLFTMSMAKSLEQLQYLGLGDCVEMEYIVAREEEKPEEAADIIVIPQLVTLYLYNMPKLITFCQGKHISEWPSLKEFTIEDCKAVDVIFGDATSCRKLEDNLSIQQPLLLVKKVEFPGMELMKISHMDNMKKIWLDELASKAFGKLKTLIVEYCPKLPSIFSSYTILIKFQNLENLTVTNCYSLEVVFHIQELNMSGVYSTSNFQLRELNLERLPKMKHVWSGHLLGTLTFECLQCLKVVECESLKSLFPNPVAKSMTQLEELQVSCCRVEEIIEEEDRGSGTSSSHIFFPRLTTLILVHLPKLRNFYKNNRTSTWPLLKKLMVKHCGKMRLSSSSGEIQRYQDSTTSEIQHALFTFEKVIPHLEHLSLAREDVMMLQHYILGNLRELYLLCYHDENVDFPSHFILQRIPNLEKLVVLCSSFEEIFPEDAFGHGGTTVGGLTEMETPLKALANLKHLVLSGLCNLRRLWKDSSLMAKILKHIEVLLIAQCPGLSIIFPSPTSFQSLTQLQVNDCASLVHVGTCSAVTSLKHLTLLILKDCDAMEDVITDDGNGAEEISFPKMEKLILDRLPSLKSFSPANCTFKFPSLVRIIVRQCPQMYIFCKGALRTPKLDKVTLPEEDDEGPCEGDLNTAIQTLWSQTDCEVLSNDDVEGLDDEEGVWEDGLDDEEGVWEDDLNTTVQTSVDEGLDDVEGFWEDDLNTTVKTMM